MQATRGTSLTSDAQPLTSRSRYGLILGVGLLGLTVDAGTKVLAAERLERGEPVEVLGSFLQLSLTSNPGAAFSTGTGLTPYISLFACAAFIGTLVVARKVRTPLWAVGFGLLLAGISGNLVDRIFREPGPLRGHVIDFLALPNWPIFNVADIWINVAAGVIILQSFRGVPLAGRPAEESGGESAGDSAPTGAEGTTP